MLHISDRLNDSPLTTSELMPRCIVTKTCKGDVFDILRILMDCFKIPSLKEALMYANNMKLNLTESVKLVDKETNTIYGILMFGETNMPFMPHMMNELFRNFKQVCGIGFLIDERLRGRGFDMKMLYHNKEYLEKFDLVWCGVDSSLPTHNYWKRLGFTECVSMPNVSFYLKLL